MGIFNVLMAVALPDDVGGASGAGTISFCYKTAKIWLLVGKVFYILKIVIPLLIIILASIDLSKAVLSNDDKEINKSIITLIKRVALGVVIFFIPTAVNLAFSIAGKMNDDIEKDYGSCFNCITKPFSKDGSCNTSYKGEGIVK